MTRLILSEDPDLTQSIEVTAENGEITVMAITDETGHPLRCQFVGLPASRAGELAMAILRVVGEG